MYEYRSINLSDVLCRIERRGPGGGTWSKVADVVCDGAAEVGTLFCNAQRMKDVLEVFIEDVNVAYGTRDRKHDLVKDEDGEVEIDQAFEDDWPDLVPTYSKALEVLGRSPLD